MNSIVIDILSRFLWTFKLRSLKGEECANALSKMFLIQKCDVMRSDGGSEFVNSHVKNLLAQNKIKHVITRNETKANYAERVIKSLKTRITKHQYTLQTHRWENVLKDVTNAYNNAFHRSIGMTPKEAQSIEDSSIWQFQYSQPKKAIKAMRIPLIMAEPYFLANDFKLSSCSSSLKLM